MKQQVQEILPLLVLFSLPASLLISGSESSEMEDANVLIPFKATLAFLLVGAFAKEYTECLPIRMVASLSVPIHVVAGTFTSMWMAEKANISWTTSLLWAPLLVLGLVLLVLTNASFVTKGDGTLSPLDPPMKLVIEGPYRHVRNPMISGIVFIMAAITLAAGVPARMLIFTLWFFLAHTLYIVFEEEPKLRERFGADYDAYVQKVNRWVPTFTSIGVGRA
ncbi:expressed unknown protein [Seminavis robusta]|uniref:Isoprenylcysteine carboxylmethyltransferase family protein n=1 Tax=Seminavis robusta TaxID=568900 RepID=A0A9N8EPD4_9STRA|nr:expressed unknown protein [Seminavis robusta]|eukprot:Sro1485_g276590.1 n/a (221) ;mRNA; r:23225-23887